MVIHFLNHKNNRNMIEMRHLQTLISLVETGNLSKAAKQLHLSQPALSHQLKAVEDHLGVAVFERKTNPLRLTPAGGRLLESAYEVLNNMSQCERDVARIAEGKAGALRIAVECHSCFDWLMPAMDVFRERWPEVEMDLVSGFQPDPVGLLQTDEADLVIVSTAHKRPDVSYTQLFSYEVLALLAKTHPLTRKTHLTARDFANEILITYPIPDDRLDIIRQLLGPAGIEPKRRTAMLTVAILQLVASQRGITAMPGWAVQPYLDKGYVTSRPVRKNGMQAKLYAATTEKLGKMAYMAEFIQTMKSVSAKQLDGIMMEE